MKKNKVFIAISLDGFIADQEGNIDWLHSIPNPEGEDMGYEKFMSGIDAILMGRNTFETILGFDIDWPYKKPVFVLSQSLRSLPGKLSGKVEIISGDLLDVIEKINSKGHDQLYIDGGKTIQSFLEEDLIDEMIITTIPIVLGSGKPLFTKLSKPLCFECTATKHFLAKTAQNHYVRTR